MAKQDTITPIRGALGEVIYFKRNGKYFCRKRVTVDPDRYRTDPAFAGHRKMAGKAARSLKLASAIYKLFRKEQRNSTNWSKLMKCTINLALLDKPMDFVICEALLKFNIITGGTTQAERANLCEVIRSNLPFASLNPANDPPEVSTPQVKMPNANCPLPSYCVPPQVTVVAPCPANYRGETALRPGANGWQLKANSWL